MACETISRRPVCWQPDSKSRSKYAILFWRSEVRVIGNVILCSQVIGEATYVIVRDARQVNVAWRRWISYLMSTQCMNAHQVTYPFHVLVCILPAQYHTYVVNARSQENYILEMPTEVCKLQLTETRTSLWLSTHR